MLALYRHKYSRACYAVSVVLDLTHVDLKLSIEATLYSTDTAKSASSANVRLVCTPKCCLFCRYVLAIIANCDCFFARAGKFWCRQTSCFSTGALPPSSLSLLSTEGRLRCHLQEEDSRGVHRQQVHHRRVCHVLQEGQVPAGQEVRGAFAP